MPEPLQAMSVKREKFVKVQIRKIQLSDAANTTFACEGSGIPVLDKEGKNESSLLVWKTRCAGRKCK
jgi:hypothetical protein